MVPRKEVDYIFDMDDNDIAAFEVFAKKVAIAIRNAFPCKKVAQVVLGLEVTTLTYTSSLSTRRLTLTSTST